MVINKALLTGLVGISLCMADISGIVTDTGTTPIAGAVVQLEKGGQADTTETDGRFTLVTNTAILPIAGKLSPNGLSAGISGNVMTVALTEQAAVEITTYDLNGKSLSTMRKHFNAGTHSIALPQRGTGVYLCEVKAGDKEFVLRGNAVRGISEGSALSSQGSSSDRLAKQALNMAATNDVIAATKTGYLNYRCVQYNADTAGVAIKMIASAGDMTDADGNVYQTVRIGNQVWMAENLRTTKYNDGSAIPFDTSTATWNNATTPKYCFHKNTTNADSIKKYGAQYNWHVVYPANPGKIASAGWHVPSDAEWDILKNYLIAKGYNWDGTITGNKVAKSLAAKTDWYTSTTTGRIGCDLTKNNRSGFSALPGGYRGSNGSFSLQSYFVHWWSATENGVSNAWSRDLNYGEYDLLYRNSNPKSCGLSVRLVRD